MAPSTCRCRRAILPQPRARHQGTNGADQEHEHEQAEDTTLTSALKSFGPPNKCDPVASE